MTPPGLPSSIHAVHSLDNRLGGGVHAVLNIAKYLSRAGAPVSVMATRQAGDELDYLGTSYPEVPHRVLPRSFPARLANSRAFCEAFETAVAGVDVVEIHQVFSLIPVRAAAICRRLRKPYFFRPHGSLDPFDLQKHARLKRLLGPIVFRPILDHCSAVLCTSKLEAERLERYGAHPRIEVVPLPVPPASGEPGDPVAFRRRHGIPAEAVVVLFLSRIDYKKGLEFLIPALASAKALEPRLWFVLAGTGEPEFLAGIQGRIQKAGIAPWTVMPGFLTGAEKQSAYLAADVFALPSRNENFGMVLVEAMRAGLPLLVSDEVYIQREIVDAGAGVACRTSGESCKAVLCDLLARQDRRAMGARSRALGEGTFSAEAATQRLLGLYGQAKVTQSRVH